MDHKNLFKGSDRNINVLSNVTETESKKQLKPPHTDLGEIKTFESGVKTSSMKYARPVYSDKKFIFKTIEVTIRDEATGDDVPAYSIGQYYINGDSQTRWATFNINALYYVRKGEPWFLIEDEGKTIQVGNYICVPANTRHCMYNKSVNSECIVDLIFPGKIVLGS